MISVYFFHIVKEHTSQKLASKIAYNP
jgi:hypothetical protein